MNANDPTACKCGMLSPLFSFIRVTTVSLQYNVVKCPTFTCHSIFDRFRSSGHLKWKSLGYRYFSFGGENESILAEMWVLLELQASMTGHGSLWTVTCKLCDLRARTDGVRKGQPGITKQAADAPAMAVAKFTMHYQTQKKAWKTMFKLEKKEQEQTVCPWHCFCKS